MSLVIDASITLAQIYRDERTAATKLVFDRVVADGAWVPSIWHLEVANSLQLGMRRKRIDAAFRDDALADLSQAFITVDPDTKLHAWAQTKDFADRFRLTLYDASYLELAQRRSLALASLDGDLRRAAEVLGLEVLGT